jgi:hypothetical protein
MVIDYSRRLVRFIVEVKNNDQHTSINVVKDQRTKLQWLGLSLSSMIEILEIVAPARILEENG